MLDLSRLRMLCWLREWYKSNKLIKTEAFVIGSIKYGDSSLIVHLFTKAMGYRSYLVKGIYGVKKRKIKPSYFQSLTHLSVVVSDKQTDRLGYIRECTILDSALQKNPDVVKSSLLLFLCEVLASVLKEENNQNTALFAYLKTTLKWLENINHLGNFHLKFLIDLTKFIGFYPNTHEMELPYFNLQTGCYSGSRPHEPFIKGKALLHFNNLLGMNFDDSLKVRLSKILRNDLLDSILMYFAFHLQGFDQPKSLEVLHEVFEVY